jgi:hypothetical protein
MTIQDDTIIVRVKITYPIEASARGYRAGGSPENIRAKKRSLSKNAILD